MLSIIWQQGPGGQRNDADYQRRQNEKSMDTLRGNEGHEATKVAKYS